MHPYYHCTVTILLHVSPYYFNYYSFTMPALFPQFSEKLPHHVGRTRNNEDTIKKEPFCTSLRSNFLATFCYGFRFWPSLLVLCSADGIQRAVSVCLTAPRDVPYMVCGSVLAVRLLNLEIPSDSWNKTNLITICRQNIQYSLLSAVTHLNYVLIRRVFSYVFKNTTLASLLKN
jgi:hypothetical protein